MKRNLIVLILILAATSLGSRIASGPLNVCGVRPGMSRAEVERILERRSEGALDKGPGSEDWFYHMPHAGRGCHCGCPQVRILYDAQDTVQSVTGHELRQGWWVLARPRDPVPNLPLEPRGETRLEWPAQHLSLELGGDIECGAPVFFEATLTR